MFKKVIIILFIFILFGLFVNNVHGATEEEYRKLEFKNKYVLHDQILYEILNQNLDKIQIIQENKEESIIQVSIPQPSIGEQIVAYAKNFIGFPYVYGGDNIYTGTDCSGFTQQVFSAFGIYLNRSSSGQSQGGTYIDFNNIQAGDLLFYDGSGYIGHVSIYCGDGTVIHASDQTTGIIISSFNYRMPAFAKRYW